MKSFCCLTILLFPVLVGASGIPGVCHNELFEWIKAKRPLAIVDVQNVADFRAHNYEHSLATGSDLAHLKNIAARLRTQKGRVIVVSADGGPDALRAAKELAKGGVFHSRLFILEGGMKVAVKNAVCDCCKPGKKDSIK